MKRYSRNIKCFDLLILSRQITHMDRVSSLFDRSKLLVIILWGLFSYKSYLTYHILVLELVKLVLLNLCSCTFTGASSEILQLLTCFQEKVVFVTCEDDDRIAGLRLLEGKHVRLCSVFICMSFCGLLTRI
jgi:hypothetical protein